MLDGTIRTPGPCDANLVHISNIHFASILRGLSSTAIKYTREGAVH